MDCDRVIDMQQNLRSLFHLLFQGGDHFLIGTGFDYLFLQLMSEKKINKNLLNGRINELTYAQCEWIDSLDCCQQVLLFVLNFDDSFRLQDSGT